jgi:hypothetical protein
VGLAVPGRAGFDPQLIGPAHQARESAPAPLVFAPVLPRLSTLHPGLVASGRAASSIEAANRPASCRAVEFETPRPTPLTPELVVPEMHAGLGNTGRAGFDPQLAGIATEQRALPIATLHIAPRLPGVPSRSHGLRAAGRVAWTAQPSRSGRAALRQELAIAPPCALPVLPRMPLPAVASGLTAAPQDRIAASIAIFKGKPAPAEVMFPAVRQPACQSIAPRPDFRFESWISTGPRLVVSACASAENIAGSVHPRMHVRLPSPPAVQRQVGLAGCASYAHRDVRLAMQAGGGSLQALARSGSLPACQYRTRSMLRPLEEKQ